MEDGIRMWVQTLVTVLCSVGASSGVWAYLMKRIDRKDVRTQMLIGLGHDRIIYLGLKYIERGWISQDEYENLYEYLYKPYSELNGNGSVKRIMQAVDQLPICKSTLDSCRSAFTRKGEKNDGTKEQSL